MTVRACAQRNGIQRVVSRKTHVVLKSDWSVVWAKTTRGYERRTDTQLTMLREGGWWWWWWEEDKEPAKQAQVYGNLSL